MEELLGEKCCPLESSRIAVSAESLMWWNNKARLQCLG
jgi:hypothetical protein